VEEQTPGPAESVEVEQTSGQSLTPHRGNVILVLGIVGLVVCLLGLFCCGVFGIAGCICGIIAWVMANKDQKEMAAGTMDPTGRETTQAGKICGIISVILGIVIFIISLLILVLVVFSHFVEQPQPM
jgi:hypothetical protein